MTREEILEELETLVDEWTHDVREYRRSRMDDAAHLAQSNLDELQGVIRRARAAQNKGAAN